MAATLLLFDIDGTLLLRASEAHRDAVYEALHQVHGIADPGSVHLDPAGRTDGEIARTIALLSGVSSERFDERAEQLREVCCHRYSELCPADLSGHLAPGVAALLDDLSARKNLLLSLVTGNFEPVARLKLERAGIGHHFPRGQGAFGSDSDDRSELPEIARRRAGSRDSGSSHPRERTIVIGDTPRDIACARADDLRVIAVATGPYGTYDLQEADHVAPDAHELAAVLEVELTR